jgi:uncharacterized protein (DUF58 family)
MTSILFLFILILIALAIFLGEGGTFVLTILYIIVGALIISRIWSKYAFDGIQFTRDFPARIFYGEKATVSLEIKNQSLLPIAWLQFRESVPPELFLPATHQHVINLGPRAKFEFNYPVEGRKRGLYDLGPMDLYSGDLLGLAPDRRSRLVPDQIMVYPKIIPLSNVSLPSFAPIGTLKHKQPIFEDPSRITGKRAYLPGDSLRKIDWKSSATSGNLLVKMFEPSIALDSTIFLDLNAEAYGKQGRFADSELAIVVAASISNWVIQKRQSVGLITNGMDPFVPDLATTYVPARHSRNQLLYLLEILSRIHVRSAQPIAETLGNEYVHLSWGTSLILLTPAADDRLFDSIFRARRAGMKVMLVLCGRVPNLRIIQNNATFFGISSIHIRDEKDLDIWRQ